MALKSKLDLERELQESVERTRKAREAAEADKETRRQAEQETVRSNVELSQRGVGRNI